MVGVYFLGVIDLRHPSPTVKPSQKLPSRWGAKNNNDNPNLLLYSTSESTGLKLLRQPLHSTGMNCKP